MGSWCVCFRNAVDNDIKHVTVQMSQRPTRNCAVNCRRAIRRCADNDSFVTGMVAPDESAAYPWCHNDVSQVKGKAVRAAAKRGAGHFRTISPPFMQGAFIIMTIHASIAFIIVEKTS